jgi:hypothetical protein
MRTVDFWLSMGYINLMYTQDPQIKHRLYRPVPMAGLTDDIVESLLPYYRKAAERNKGKLEAIGRKIGGRVVSIAYAKLNMKPPEGVKVAKSKPLEPAWLQDLIDPVINPVVDGFKQEIEPKLIKPISQKIVGIVVMAAVGGLVAGYLLGRRR